MVQRITALEVGFKNEKAALEEKIHHLDEEVTALQKRIGAYDMLAAKAGGAFMALLALGTLITMGWEKAMHVVKSLFRAGGAS